MRGGRIERGRGQGVELEEEEARARQTRVALGVYENAECTLLLNQPYTNQN